MPLSRFDGQTALEMAKQGFKCHVSQREFFSVSDRGMYDCRKFGLAYTTVGYDTAGENDMFEHVDWSDKIPEAPAEPTVSQSDAVSASGSTARSAVKGYPAVFCIAAGIGVLAAIVIVLWVKRRAYMQN